MPTLVQLSDELLGMPALSNQMCAALAARFFLRRDQYTAFILRNCPGPLDVLDGSITVEQINAWIRDYYDPVPGELYWNVHRAWPMPDAVPTEFTGFVAMPIDWNDVELGQRLDVAYTAFLVWAMYRACLGHQARKLSFFNAAGGRPRK